MLTHFRQKPVKCFLSVCFVFLLCFSSAKSQSVDTLQFSLQQAEKQFIDSNFLLLAAHYNIDAQKALIEQAKVWQNPTINTDFVLGADGKFLKGPFRRF